MENEKQDMNLKLKNILSGLSKEKIAQVTKMVQSMSKEDLNNLTKMFGMNDGRR